MLTLSEKKYSKIYKKEEKECDVVRVEIPLEGEDIPLPH